jgi:hypothetical protein
MTEQNFTTSFTVDQTPAEVYAAINNVRGWWSEEVVGRTDQLGQVFYYHFQDLHRCTIQVTELIPNQKVAWRVLDNHFSFIQDQREWKDTETVFQIIPKGNKTEVHFTHVGLVPAYECFNVCSNAWGTYLNGSLKHLITTGKGEPNLGRPITAGEKELSHA